MPTIYELDLAFGAPNIADPRHLHAVVSSWLDGDRAAGLSEHRDTDKPWAVGPQQPHADGMRLLVRLLDDRLATRLDSRAHPGAAVVFGDSRGHVSGAVRGGPRRIFAVSWDELDDPMRVRRWQLHLQAPVVFNSQRYHVRVDATSILRTLAHRWQCWHPDGERVDVAPDAFAVRTDLRAVRQPYDLPTMPRHALVGRLDIWAKGDEGALSLSKLVQWAQFAGIGAKTTHGFGATAVRPCSD